MIFDQQVPRPFMGGPSSDYEKFVGEAGNWNTRHIPSGKSIPVVDAGSGGQMDVMGLANLGVGLLNLGVGVFNAVQINKARNDVKALSANVARGFATVQASLEQQAGILNALLRAGAEASADLKTLLREQRAGFADVHAHLDQQEADEFLRRCLSLTAVWSRFSLELIHGEATADERQRLLDKADDLESWARVALRKHAQGSLARMPFLVASAMAQRATADVKEVTGGAGAMAARHRLEQGTEEIEQEVKALCAGQTPYGLAVEVRPALEAYAYLRRGLVAGAAGRPGRLDGKLTGPMPWFGPAAQLEELFAAPAGDVARAQAPNLMRLSTLDDYEWYLELTGQDRKSFDVHSKADVWVSDLTALLGAPANARIQEEKLPLLRAAVLPGPRAELVRAIQAEFGIREPLELPAPKLGESRARPQAQSAPGGNASASGERCGGNTWKDRYGNWMCSRCTRVTTGEGPCGLPRAT